MDENKKISRAAFLGTLGGMAAATVFWKFSSFTSLFTTGRWQTAGVGSFDPNAYGNSTYGGISR